MCTLKLPFSGDDVVQIAFSIIKDKPKRLPSAYSEEMDHMIKHMMQKDPTKRPNINNILKFPIL